MKKVFKNLKPNKEYTITSSGEYGGPPKEFVLTASEHEQYFGGLRRSVETQIEGYKKRKKKKK